MPLKARLQHKTLDRTGTVYRFIRGYDMTTKQLLNDAIALVLMAVAFILSLFI